MKRQRYLLVGVLVALACPASAAPPGLYAEHSTTMDGVTLRRVADKANGTICYVASARSPVYGGTSVAVSVSCVRGTE